MDSLWPQPNVPVSPPKAPEGPSNHWQHHARQWGLVRPPLRPCAEDISILRRWLRQWQHEHTSRNASAVILGVTPELCTLAMRLGFRVTAVDNSPDMIGALWPREATASDKPVCGDWRSIPLPEHSTDVVLADGSFCLLPYREGYIGVLAEVRRLLKPGGVFMVRCFVQPEIRESVGQVFSALGNGEIGNFHILKWRLLMALQEGAKRGVSVGLAWNAIRRVYPELSLLAQKFEWPLDEVRTIEAYRDVATCYSFPTRSEFLATFVAAGFTVADEAVPTYELGERCPSFWLS